MQDINNILKSITNVINNKIKNYALNKIVLKKENFILFFLRCHFIKYHIKSIGPAYFQKLNRGFKFMRFELKFNITT